MIRGGRKAVRNALYMYAVICIGLSNPLGQTPEHRAPWEEPESCAHRGHAQVDHHRQHVDW